MQQIRFTCPSCKKKLIAKHDAGGKTLNCPSCNKLIAIPAPIPRDGAIPRHSLPFPERLPPKLVSIDCPIQHPPLPKPEKNERTVFWWFTRGIVSLITYPVVVILIYGCIAIALVRKVIYATGGMISGLIPCSKKEKLYEAIRSGDPNAVCKVIAQGAAVNILLDPTGITPLHVAVGRGLKNVVSVLIANGAVVNARGPGGYTPLHVCAVAGHETLVDLLVSKGALLDAQDDTGSTPLHAAAQANQPRTAEALIRLGCAINPHMKETNWTPLDWAILRQNTAVTEILQAHCASRSEEGL